MKKTPIIMDVDTGIDDAIALMLALQADELEVKGITVVAGNQILSKTLHNTLSVVEYLGRKDIPVAKGADRPLVRDQFTAGKLTAKPALALQSFLSLP